MTMYIIASQFLPAGWHENLGGGAVADAILDRVIANSYTIHIKGEKSMRARELVNILTSKNHQYD